MTLVPKLFAFAFTKSQLSRRSCKRSLAPWLLFLIFPRKSLYVFYFLLQIPKRYIIGGDGTHRGANVLYEGIKQRRKAFTQAPPAAPRTSHMAPMEDVSKEKLSPFWCFSCTTIAPPINEKGKQWLSSRGSFLFKIPKKKWEICFCWWLFFFFWLLFERKSKL